MSFSPSSSFLGCFLCQQKVRDLGQQGGMTSWFKHHLYKGRIIVTSGLNMFKPMGGPTLPVIHHERKSDVESDLESEGSLYHLSQCFLVWLKVKIDPPSRA